MMTDRIYRYCDTARFDREHIVVADWDRYMSETEEFIRGIGTVVGDVTDYGVTFYVDAADLWDLHEKVEEVKTELASRGMQLQHDSKDLVVAIDRMVV
jgi:hypothetical protein